MQIQRMAAEEIDAGTSCEESETRDSERQVGKALQELEDRELVASPHCGRLGRWKRAYGIDESLGTLWGVLEALWASCH